MVRALLIKEFKLLISSYLTVFVVNFLLYGAASAALLLSAGGMMPGTVFGKGFDPFVTFCLLSVSFSSMFFSMAGPNSLIEKSTGILDNMLAYTRSAQWVFVSKALFLWAAAFVSFLFWGIAAAAASPLVSMRFVDGAFLGRDLVLGLLVYPILLLCLSMIQVYFYYVFPQVAPLVNVVLFALAFMVLINLAWIAGSLQVASLALTILTAFPLGFLAVLLAALMRAVPLEMILRP